MRRILTTALVGLLCAAGVAGAQERGAQESASPSATEIVQARLAALALSGVALGAIKAGIDAGVEPRTQAFPAGSLAKWAHAVPAMFPAPVEGVASRARPEVWSNRADFEAKSAAFAAATDRLAELARANDAEGFTAQWGAVRQTCGACHDAYRTQ
jgi:cytochrome c556